MTTEHFEQCNERVVTELKSSIAGIRLLMSDPMLDTKEKTILARTIMDGLVLLKKEVERYT